MFRTLRLIGASVEMRATTQIALPPPGEKCWIDLCDFEAPDLELLRQQFQFHPLEIEDCATPDHRAKAEEYGDHLFVIMQALALQTANGEELQAAQVAAFLGERYLVTVHRKPIQQLETVWRRALSEEDMRAQGVDFFLYLIVDAVIDDAFPIIDAISDRLEGIEAEILDRVEQSQLVRLLDLRRQLIEIRRLLAPHRDMVAMLVRRGDPRISEKTALYFRDVYDHVIRAYEEIDTERDLLGNAMESLHLDDGKSDQQYNEATHDFRFDFPASDFLDRILRTELHYDAVCFRCALPSYANCLRRCSNRYAVVVPAEELAIVDTCDPVSRDGLWKGTPRSTVRGHSSSTNK